MAFHVTPQEVKLPDGTVFSCPKCGGTVFESPGVRIWDAVRCPGCGSEYSHKFLHDLAPTPPCPAPQFSQ